MTLDEVRVLRKRIEGLRGRPHQCVDALRCASARVEQAASLMDRAFKEALAWADAIEGAAPESHSLMSAVTREREKLLAAQQTIKDGFTPIPASLLA